MSAPRPIVPIALIGIFFVLAFAVHHTAFTAPLQYDSAAYLKNNEYVFRSGIIQVINLYPPRPIPMIAFYIDYLSAGMNPYYFRLVNTFFMACTAAVVVLLLNRILEIPGIKVRGTPGQKHVVSFALGLVFLLHPVAIYVVVYVWQRFALLSGLFFFSALAAYLATRTGRIKNAALGYAACAIMFFLAVASKENAIALPVILLLAELAFFHTSLRGLLKRSAVFGAVVLIAALVLSFVEPRPDTTSHGGILAKIGRYYDESGLTPAQVVIGQCVVFFEYLKMVVLPLPSNVHLISPQIVPSSITELPETTVAVVGVVALTCAGLGLLWMRPLVGFGTLFFIVNLLPEAVLVPQYLFFGYRVFVPMFGLLLIAADGILTLIDLPQSARGKLAVKAGLTTAAGVAIVLLGCATISKEALWMDPIAFWKDVRARFPSNDERLEKHIKVQALNNLGFYLAASGDVGQAISLHRESLRVGRRFPHTYICLGSLYADTGQLGDAAAMYGELLRLDKNNANAHAGLAAVLVKQNKPDEALEQYYKAVEREPGHPDYNFGLATVWLAKNDYASAMPLLQRTIESNPNHVQARYNMGKVLAHAGRTAEAITQYQAALSLDPTFWTAHNNLGVLLATKGRLSEAIDHFHKALKIKPDDGPTQRNLETALKTLEAAGKR